MPLAKTKRDPFFAGRVALVTVGTRGIGIAVTCARDPDEVDAAFLALGSSDRVVARDHRRNNELPARRGAFDLPG